MNSPERSGSGALPVFGHLAEDRVGVGQEFFRRAAEMIQPFVPGIPVPILGTSAPAKTDPFAGPARRRKFRLPAAEPILPG